jgi:hypothetical protein
MAARKGVDPPVFPAPSTASLPPVGQNASIGHNAGPPLEEPDPDSSWRLFCWKRAHKRAWTTPPPEIALRRLARAEQLGISYREYTAEILDRGRFL